MLQRSNMLQMGKCEREGCVCRTISERHLIFYRKRPPKVGRGFFDWVKPVAKVTDDILIQTIGWDAVLFIRCLRMFRRMFYGLTAVGVFVLIPINIAATSQTG
jgi:hypothetical protein